MKNFNVKHYSSITAILFVLISVTSSCKESTETDETISDSQGVSMEEKQADQKSDSLNNPLNLETHYIMIGNKEYQTIYADFAGNHINVRAKFDWSGQNMITIGDFILKNTSPDETAGRYRLWKAHYCEYYKRLELHITAHPNNDEPDDPVFDQELNFEFKKGDSITMIMRIKKNSLQNRNDKCKGLIKDFDLIKLDKFVQKKQDDKDGSILIGSGDDLNAE